LPEQPLLAGLTPEELTDLTSLGTIRMYQAGEKIITAGDPATSLFFLRSGVVHVTLPDGIRMATLTAGMAFGEMALLESHRSADVLTDAAATAFEVPLRDFERFRKQHPRAGERIMRNLAQLLADRLILANAKVNLLTSG
jgi:glutaminase